jgi:hypothetical protein
MEAPIIFTTPMIQAILAGRKTQTRRLFKPDLPYPAGSYPAKWHYSVYHETLKGGKTEESLTDGIGHVRTVKCPYGRPGDTLWVRETWCTSTKGWIYRADGIEIPAWRSPRFMPKNACRIRLLIKNIRVEKLNDISEDDAKAEGVLFRNMPQNPIYTGYINYDKPEGIPFSSSTLSFRSLWESINGKDSWETNPWVWVIEFQKI